MSRQGKRFTLSAIPILFIGFLLILIGPSRAQITEQAGGWSSTATSNLTMNNFNISMGTGSIWLSTDAHERITGNGSQIDMWIANSNSWRWTNTYMGGTGSTSGVVSVYAASATNPSLLPMRFDGNSGVGSNGEDQPNIVAGGVEAIRFTEDTHITHLRSGLNARYSSETVADEAEITYTTGVAGWGTVMAGDNEAWASFTFTAGGAVTIEDSKGSVVNTDTDTNLCIYDAGTGIAIKNRLGASKTVSYVIYHF